MITGGAGFIGANFINWLFKSTEFSGRVINYDKLTYAGNLESLAEIEKEQGEKSYFFVQGDICDRKKVEKTLVKYEIDTIIHFAAESHVDRSIEGPEVFIQTNVMGTFTLLDAARHFWAGKEGCLFHHVSTDEVYGSLGETGFFHETTPYDPRSAYSASKASSDHLVRSYYHTYGLPFTLSNCSNNYGPYQFPEKLIPVIIENILHQKELPVYGDGKNIRDWLYVEDHNSAVWEIVNHGRTGESYNIGGENEWENIHLVNRLCEILAEEQGKNKEEYKKLITFVKDRPGHDRRYAINCDKLKTELGWKQSLDFDKGLKETVKWYMENREWVNNVQSGEYKKWIKTNYKNR
jgi:dTDP-glucose 4,6-dehydratase